MYSITYLTGNKCTQTNITLADGGVLHHKYKQTVFVAALLNTDPDNWSASVATSVSAIRGNAVSSVSKGRPHMNFYRLIILLTLKLPY